MPKVKNSTRNNTEMSMKRLRIIDDILQRSGHVPTRDELLRRVNARLMEPVGISTIDKDIRSLRDCLDSDKRGVRLLRINGSYQYSMPGFSYFTDHVWEEELSLFKLLMNILSNHLDDTSNRLMRSLADKLTSMCPSAPDVLPTEHQACYLNLGVSTRLDWLLLPAIWMHMENRTTCRFVLSDTDGVPRTIHLSPYCLMEGNDNFWLIGLDMSEDSGNGVVACRVSKIQMLQPSHMTFREDRRIDAVMYGNKWSANQILSRTMAQILTWYNGDWQEDTMEDIKQRQPLESVSNLAVASRSNLTHQPWEEGRMMMDMANRIERFAS